MLQEPEISVPPRRPEAINLSTPPKKGMRDHAERLVDLSEKSGIQINRPIIVVGDGRSDHFMFRSLESIRRTFPDMPQPNGFFLRNPALELYEANSEHCHYFSTWRALCEAISSEKITHFETMAIVDIDRTLILPRGLMDKAYESVRTRSLRNLASLFAISAEAQCEADKIDDVANELEGSLCYYRDQGDQLCYENFEVIALTAVLKTMGLLSDESICRTLPPDEELLDTLERCRSEAGRGNWIAQFDHNAVGSHVHWNEELTIKLLTDAIDALRMGIPSITPMFRKIEFSELLDAKRDNTTSFFNWELTRALFQSPIRDIIFLSDRPISSVYDGENFVLEDILSFRAIGK